ncbi:MAG: PD-(D/E)XK nuclease family protein, partial [candidate division Zixibacteria bacterium]|nr:PD-(D/E)XK nuclease family protein [candidate division Zixibacteria bacterium]
MEQPETDDLKALSNFAYNNPELEELEDSIGKFNIFTSLKLAGNEIRHSNFLAWLMDPFETHGLGDYFIKNLLKNALSDQDSILTDGLSLFDIDCWDLRDAEIRREWNRIDILVLSESNKFVCVIENKVYSGEHHHQLSRYKSIVERSYNDYKRLYIYLTIEGEEPTESDYRVVSYRDVTYLVEALLKRKKASMANDVSTFIEHYASMLRREIMDDSEIQEICRKIYRGHRQALDVLFNNREDELLAVKNCLVDIIEADSELELDDCSKVFIRFVPRSIDFVPKLVSRQPHNVGYNLFSLILASSLVKRQSTFASISFRCVCQ